MQWGLLVSKKDMGKYDGWTCLAIVFSQVIFGFYLSLQNSFLISCLGVQVSCPDTASALLHEARKIRLNQVVWPYDYTDSVCAAQAHGCAAQVQCNAMKCHAM